VALTDTGPRLVDATRPRQWALTLALALLCIAAGTLIAVSIRAGQY
jgi:hypothetical protein